jgi:hypothetical protein
MLCRATKIAMERRKRPLNKPPRSSVRFQPYVSAHAE